MLPVEWSDEALSNLFDIYAYVVQRNVIAANNLEKTIKHVAEHQLPLMPYAFRKGKVAGTRECVVHPNYIVVYRVNSSSIRILRIMHARQQYP